ncbi:phosphatase PAP2 family protein [Clostridium algidicarnis]|uniref:phosphatase PAP2 family protein n=1 Tax=Clostridium algidicarnis TaxID=37659 RepID=UPI0016241C7D|nr:phosphatase PAP2 family protein [Clostridium algidicarnis]MBB6696516.1 phosphatase PAP2 family protein [Clostridium algidicarnis]MBU3205843.1 phosphatase PAP2 family protein [Clostridium algidicarnis]
MISLIQKFDRSILIFIKDNMNGPVMDKAMVMATRLGDMGMIWLIIASALIINKKYRKIGIMALAALGLSTILGEGILKHVVHRIRPSSDINVINILIAKPLSYSFPSGHTTSSFAVAGVLSKHFKKYAVGFFALASLIAFSRLYLYVHYPTDVLVGIILGLLCSWVINHVFERIIYKHD